MGGIINANSIKNNNGDWCLEGWFRKNDGTYDVRTPLDHGVYYGDSGSPLYVWDAENNQFLLVATMFASNVQIGYDNYFKAQFYPTKAQEYIDKYTVAASFSGSDTIVWGTQNAETGKGFLTQGDVSVEYTGKGSSNTLADTLGLTFSTEADSVQTLELQGNVNMGVGALTFEKGKWRLTELADQNFTLTSAGFDIQKGAEVTWELTGASSQEIRKVGEGILTISGTGNNESTLVVGGGTTIYNVETDENGNIIGCTLGNAGETRLNRDGGYAASSVRLEGGVAIIVLMADEQFKTKTTAGDTFSFGNRGGLLNLNGHDLTWGVINQDGSGTGARIGNFTPSGFSTPENATFTYNGTGTFAGCFMDEGAEGAQLSVVYNNATDGATWKLTGNHSNAGGFTVQDGTMVLEGTNTPHVNLTDAHDWTYATIQGANVTVKNGAAFQLSHHAQMVGDITVENGGSFILNQTVNAASESISGSLRQDMTGIKALIGDVILKESGSGVAQMVANVSSPVSTIIDGNISIGLDTGNSYRSVSLVKKGTGILSVTGSANLFGVNIEEGGLVIGDGSKNDNWFNWTIGEKGFLAAVGADNIQYHLTYKYINQDSKGVLALTQDQTTQLNLTNHQNLIIGAWGDVSYGTSDATLSTVFDAASQRNVWRLGGGTGTLTVDFLLTGDNDLIISNQYSNGTVHLANANNDFSGKIYIQGLGNILTYEEGALGSAKVSLPYGNAMSLYSAEQFNIIDAASSGVLGIAAADVALDMSGKTFSLGANGDITYTGTLTVGAEDTYRFGGVGNLTLDTALNQSTKMELDAQGLSGSSVTFARENAFAGDIVAGGSLHMEDADNSGNIAIHAGHANALADASSIALKKGAVLYTDGQDMTVANLSIESGAQLLNTTESVSHVNLLVDDAKNTSIVNGALSGSNIHLTKTGEGTLTMGYNSSWSGGLTIDAGTVVGSLTSTGWGFTSGGGIGAEGNVITVSENATLRINAARRTGRALGGTQVMQTLLGTGTIEFSAGGSALFSTQSQSFEGTLRLVDNTRLYLGTKIDDGSDTRNTLSALNKATIEVTAGSQVRITSALYRQYAQKVNVYSDFILNGSGFAGSTDAGCDVSTIDRLPGGALSIDFGSTVYGDVTLASSASISSVSNKLGNNAAQCINAVGAYYGIAGYLGGTIRGRILGTQDTALTIIGNEGITITADSANTYGDLNIANSGKCNNTDVYALRLDGGRAVNQTSTALGTGSVTLNSGLILRLAGTGVENNSDVVYTYENNMSVGAGATLQSYNITNRLTGTVAMSGNSLNLATARGGVLELAGGINGSGTLNVAAGSKVILDSASAGYGTPQFSGTVAAGDGADITLASPAVVATDTAFTGTDNLTLRLSGTENFTLGSISMTGETSTLNLNFDFSAVPDAADAATWNTLTVTNGITAGSTIIDLALNMFGDIKKGSYTLITAAGDATDYDLADTMNGRLSLSTESGALVLTVGDDNRLYWRTDGASEAWNTTDANWYSDATSTTGYTTFAPNANVMLDSTGVAEGNGSAARETITLSDSLTVGTLGVKTAAYEVTGTGAITASSLTVGEGGDLKLSNTGGNTFTNGVLVNNASLSVNSTGALAANVNVENNASFTLAGGSMTGQLTVTDASAAISNATLTGNVKAKGTGSLSLNNATFSNADSSIAFDYGTLSMTAGTKLGGTYNWVEFQPTVQVENMAIAGGTLTSNVALQVGALEIASGATMVLSGSTNATIDSISGGGALRILPTSTLQLNLGSVSGLSTFDLLGGTTNVSGTMSFADGTRMSLGNAVLNLNDGAAVTTTHFRMGDQRMFNDVTYSTASTTVTIHDGASLTITGSNDSDATTTSFLLAHWGSSPSSLTLNGGTLTATSTTMHMGWDSGGTFKALKGEATLKGVRFGATGGRQNADAFYLGTATEGSAIINIGASGITGIGTNDTVALGEGTIAATANFSVNGNAAVQFVGSNTGTQFDTKGHTITLNTATSGSGNIVKKGQGTLSFHGSGESYSGHISVQEGALAVNSTGKSVLTSAASVSFADDTVLDLSAIDFSAEGSAIDVSYGTKISLSDSSVVAFANMQEDTEYSIFNITNGELTGWSGFTAENFSVNGVMLPELGRVSVNLGMAGTFSYSFDRYDLVWNGGATGTWNSVKDNTAWLVMQDGTVTDTATHFVNNDNVTFNSSASLQVADGVIVNNVTIEGNSTVTLDGAALTADKVTIESGSKLKGAYASVLVPVKTFDIAAGATLEMYVPGGPTYTAEVTGEGAVTMTGGGTLTWNAADGSLSIGELNITGGGTFKTTSAYTGTTVNITNGSAQFDGDVSVDTMNVAAGKTVTLWNAAAASGADKNISTLHLANGAKLQTNDRAVVTAATTIGTLNLTGSSATLQDVNHSGWIAVHNITGGADSTLNLVKNAMSNNVGIFTLGDAEGTTESGSAFAGTISVKQATVTENGHRDVALLLNHATVAQAATIDLNSATTSADANDRGAYVGLGVNVASATIGGLKSGQALGERAILFSGSQASNAAWADKSATTEKNTLTISPASGTTHEYYGQVQNVNLVVDGAGTQKFLGTTNAGSIGVKNGTLMLGCVATADTVDVSNGTMKVNFTSANGATITDNASGSFTVGTLNYTGGTLEMSGTVNITTLKVGAGLTATVYNNGASAGQNKTFGTVELGAGATLKTYDNDKVAKATDFGTLKFMGDSASIQDAWHAGYYHVDALTMREGVTSSTLNLKKTASSTLATVFELGNAGDTTSNFAGKINLQQTSTGKGRSAFVVLSNANIAQNAVISMTDASDTSESAYIGLGINADQTTIAGLESTEANGSIAKLFSGKIGTEVEWTAKTGKTTPPATVGDAVRTLNITTKAGGEHEFYGEVLGSLNLVIDGEGTQKFLGTSNSFNGTVTVQGGTAAFNATGTSLLEHATAFTLTDGVLDLSAITFGTDSTNAISLASGATYSFSDGVIDLGNLDADTTYHIFDLSAENTTLSGWDLDTLGLGNFRINGSSMADADEFVDISLGADGTFRYTMTNPEENPLYWSGGSSADWNTTAANWDATPDVADDGLVAFRDKSAVVFASSATVNITEEVEAYSVIITDGAEVKLTMGANGGLATGEVVVDAGTLELGSEKNWQHLSYVTVGEEGVLRLMYGVGINNTQDATDIFLNGGKIELRNGAGANKVLHADMVVDGSGTIAGSRNGDGTTISGTISGNGTLTFEADSGNNNWMTVSSIVSDGEDGTLALHVKDAQVKLTNAANSYTGTTTVEAGTLELQGAGQVGKGDVSIAAGAELAAATTATQEAESEVWASITSTSDTAAATVSGATITQTEASKTLDIASRSTDGTRGTLENTLVQIASDATLTVDSMMISPGSRISGAASLYAARAAESSLARVQLHNSILQLDTSNSSVADAPVTMDLGTLQATGSCEASGALTLGAASKVLTVSTDVFSNLALTSGTNFVVDFSSLLSSIDVADADFVYLSFADTVSADWSTTTLTGTWNDYQMDAYYHTAVATGAAVPNVGVYFDVRTIPEPTSTTLSILALAALAARRRRK